VKIQKSSNWKLVCLTSTTGDMIKQIFFLLVIGDVTDGINLWVFTPLLRRRLKN